MRAAPALLLLGLHAASAQVQPFTLHLTEGPVGGPSLTKTIIRTATGARAEIRRDGGPNDNGLGPRMLQLPEAGKRVLISDKLKLISTYSLSSREITALSTPTSSPICAADAGQQAKLTGEEYIFSVLTLRYESPLRGGAEKLIQWYAPKLDCLSLRDEFHKLDSNGWQLTFSRIPTQLRLSAEPGDEFQLPTEYREVPPSEHQKAAIALQRGTPFGSHPNDAGHAATFERLDRHYHQSRQIQPRQ